jgi:hypothetical protein
MHKGCRHGRLEKELHTRVGTVLHDMPCVDADIVASVLRDVYPEYRRQKFAPFLKRVEEAVDCILQEMGAPELRTPATAGQVCFKHGNRIFKRTLARFLDVRKVRHLGCYTGAYCMFRTKSASVCRCDSVEHPR